MSGSGTGDNPYDLTTPPGKSGYQIWRDADKDEPGKVTLLSYFATF